MDLFFEFSAECWLWQAEKGSWHFITVPKESSEEIKFFSENMQSKRRGWGAVRVQATVNGIGWETSIFPHSKSQTYILPVKSEIRKRVKIAVGDLVNVQLKIAL